MTTESLSFEGMCCQIALDQCNKIYVESDGRAGWEPTVCPHGPGAAKIVGRDPYKNGGGGTHTNSDAYKEYCNQVRAGGAILVSKSF